MAKIIFGKRRGERTEFHARAATLRAEFDKVKYPSGWKFRSCVWLRGAGSSYKVQRSVGCGVGSNPRVALAGAMRASARQIEHGSSLSPGRRGVFEGYSRNLGRKRKHRRVRRGH